ncbi:hypothetical protein [Vampirovibrio chlorellavorus]|uniref:hypothetical protein n=1 Tax=Vampirovibrio chlorellavorus TaxID=758823 RepID=UPI0026ED0FD7|nr:hypothetical protein [Vampirovibrio chlorellavorus]
MASTPSISTANPLTPPSALRRSNSVPNLSTQPSADPITSDSVKIQGNKPSAVPAEEVPNPTKNTNLFFEPLQDLLGFIKKLYQKFMDFFTPTSKEAIEKSLAKAGSKQRKYLDRISLQEALQAPEKGPPELQAPLEALTSTEQEFIVKDGQKAKKKLEALTPKIEKLAAKYTKLTGITITETTSQNSEASDTKPKGKVSQQSPITPPKAAVTKNAENTGESLVKDLVDAIKDILDPNGETAQELKKACPALADIFENMLKPGK